MAHRLEEVQNDALQLSPDDRIRLIQALHESVMTDEEPEAEQALIEEAERRYQDWKAGRARSVPGAEVIARLRDKYGSASVRASRRR